jgi:hypothetical protein
VSRPTTRRCSTRTAAELPLDEIRALVDALLEAHGESVPPLRAGAAG